MHQCGLETTMGAWVSSLALDKVSNCSNVLRGPRPEEMTSNGAVEEGIIGPADNHIAHDVMTIAARKIPSDGRNNLGLPPQRCWAATARTTNRQYFSVARTIGMRESLTSPA
jgi:hypothetical protein